MSKEFGLTHNMVAMATLTDPVVMLDIVLLGGNKSLEAWVTGLLLVVFGSASVREKSHGQSFQLHVLELLL